MTNRRTKRTKSTKRTKKVSGKTSAKKSYVDYNSLRIVPVEKASPRRESTKAGKRYASMLKFISKHHKASAKEVFKNSDYRSDDAQWDAKRGYVKLVRSA